MPISSMEAEANKKNDWKTVSKAEFYGVKKAPYTEEVMDDVNDPEVPRSVLDALYKETFGENPHHRMKDSTIKEKLNDANNS